MLVRQQKTQISWETLLDLARRWDESAIVQRLGYLLDLHQVRLPPDVGDALRALVAPASKVHLGPRAEWGTGGRLVSPWGILENVPPKLLVEPGRELRRARSFPKRMPP